MTARLGFACVGVAVIAVGLTLTLKDSMGMQGQTSASDRMSAGAGQALVARSVAQEIPRPAVTSDRGQVLDAAVAFEQEQQPPAQPATPDAERARQAAKAGDLLDRAIPRLETRLAERSLPAEARRVLALRLSRMRERLDELRDR